MDVSLLFAAVCAGDPAALSKAITLVESSRDEDRAQAVVLADLSLKEKRQSVRIAISGTPGAGKSTLIQEVGLRYIEQGHRVAVLAIDPTSPVSGGSILGDKTRMDRLSASENAFIRPSPSRGIRGGVGRHTREAIHLCEAAGFNIIIVETVGVGQSELTAHDMVDIFVVLGTSGTGDELQGIKRGALELADIVVVTKADGNNEALAKQTRSMLRGSVSLFPPSRKSWERKVLVTSVVSGLGIDQLLNTIGQLEKLLRSSGELEDTRLAQLKTWFEEEVRLVFADRILSSTEFARVADQLRRGEADSAPPALAGQFIASLLDR